MSEFDPRYDSIDFAEEWRERQELAAQAEEESAAFLATFEAAAIEAEAREEADARKRIAAARIRRGLAFTASVNNLLGSMHQGGAR